MDNKGLNLDNIPEALKSMMKNLDTDQLMKVKNSLDKEKVNNLVTDILGTLQQSLPAKDYTALTELIDSLKK